MEFGGYGPYDGYYNGNYNNHHQQHHLQQQQQQHVGFYDSSCSIQQPLAPPSTNSTSAVSDRDLHENNCWPEEQQSYFSSPPPATTNNTNSTNNSVNSYEGLQHQPMQEFVSGGESDSLRTLSRLAKGEEILTSSSLQQQQGNTTSSNSPMIPVRLDNMAPVARTKAGMRRLAAEQRESSLKETIFSVSTGAGGNPEGGIGSQQQVKLEIKVEDFAEDGEKKKTKSGNKKTIAKKKTQEKKILTKSPKTNLNNSNVKSPPSRPKKKRKLSDDNTLGNVVVGGGGSPPKSPKKEKKISITKKEKPPAKNKKQKKQIGKIEPSSERGRKSGFSCPSVSVIGGQVKFTRDGHEENYDVAHTRTSVNEVVRSVEFDASVAWECVFCGGGPDVHRLGDLFGPYYVNAMATTNKKKTPKKKETWMHQECAVWAGDVVLVGASLRGLDAAVDDAARSVCAECKRRGASVACSAKKCTRRAHFPCAKTQKWKFDTREFSALCNAHK